MKKITFLLFALIAGTSFGQTSATDSGTATVNAEIVSPISITPVGSNLDFGRIIGNTAGGTVTVSTAGLRTSDNSDLLAPTAENTIQAALFQVTAATTYKYSVTIDDITLTGSGDPMAVTFTSSLGNENVVGTGAPQDLTVGGALAVNASQEEGKYSGTVTVVVAYE